MQQFLLALLFVLEVAIPSYNSSEWKKAVEIVESA